MKGILCALVLCATTGAWAAPAPSAPDDKPTRASRTFTERAQAYVNSVKELEARQSAQKSTADVERITTEQQELATRVVAARRGSRQGDIFTPDIAKELRQGIRKAFRGSEGRSMRRTILESDPAAPGVLRVNDIYPEEYPVITMPVTLLRWLPILPPELMYRIVGRSLVLQGMKTNLIVDILPNAIPRAGR